MNYDLGEILALVLLNEVSGTADPGVRLSGRPGNSFLENAIHPAKYRIGGSECREHRLIEVA
jgi:hypothetical protein